MLHDAHSRWRKVAVFPTSVRPQLVRLMLPERAAAAIAFVASRGMAHCPQLHSSVQH
jgi:hypothetical protein